MEWPPSSLGCGSPETMKTMIEQAEEELQILETQHPNRFEYLKLELKSFIDLLQSQKNLPLSNTMASFPSLTSVPPSFSVTTQASSSSKKRKMRGEENDKGFKGSKQKIQMSGADDSLNRKMDRVEFVIEKAQNCLRKIQQFKTSIF